MKVTEVDVGQIISENITRIVAELKGLPDRTAKDEHAAFCNCIDVMLRDLRGAGHHVPPFLIGCLVRMAQSAPESPHRHADKMFTVNSDDASVARDPAGFAERFKRNLPIALINLLVTQGWKPAVAMHRVANACGIDVRKLYGQRKRTGLSDKKADLEEQLDYAMRFVSGEYSKLRASKGQVEAHNELIRGIAALMSEF